MMSNIKTILGRDIDLVTIQQQNPQSEIQRKLPEVDYVGIKWREIPEHPTDDNLGVRALGTPNAFDTLGFDLKRNGWDITNDLPVEDVDDGELNDGRPEKVESWVPLLKKWIFYCSPLNCTRTETCICGQVKQSQLFKENDDG